MGLFSRKPSYPELDENTELAGKVKEFQPGILAAEGHFRDKMEMVFHNDRAYLYLGKPPKKFAFAWIVGDKVVSLAEVAKKQGLPPTRTMKVVGRLAEAYSANEGAEKVTCTVGNITAVATDDEGFGKQIAEILASP